jgi:hypothetical protein
VRELLEYAARALEPDQLRGAGTLAISAMDDTCGQFDSLIARAGQGKTRADAPYRAISNYHSMMTVDLNRNGSMNPEPSPQGSWGSTISSPCHITRSTHRDGHSNGVPIQR